MRGLFETPELGPCCIEPWPFQAEGIEATFAALKVHRRVLVNIFTGGGKTLLAALICLKGVKIGRKILFLVPTIELAQQAAAKFDLVGLTAMIEQAGQRARILFEPNVVIGSLMTMKDVRRLESFGRDYFDLVVVDEAHGSMAESTKRVLAYFERAKVIGLTATILRGDGQDLGHIFDVVAYRYSLIDALQASPPGPYACDIIPVTCDLEIDLRKLKKRKGDFTDRDLDERITPMIDMMANKTKQKIGCRRTLVFLPSIRSAQLMAAALGCLGLKAEAVWGSDPDRDQKIKRYRSGETQVLTNMNLCSTGFDVPETAAVVLARPTTSHTLYIQMMGRGTRRNKPERDCLLVDFAWLTDEFSPVQAADLLADPGFDAEAAEIARELLEKTPGLSMMNAIDRAESEIEERKIRRKQYAIRISVAERAVECNEASYSMMEAYGDGGNREGWSPAPMSPAVKGPSQAQINLLLRLNYRDAAEWSREKANFTLGKFFKQRAAGKSTPSQRGTLARKGVNMADAREMSKEEATEAIDRTAPRRVR